MTSLVTGNRLSAKISDKVQSHITDHDPSKIDMIAKQHHYKFFPAGTSVQTLYHFRQLMQTGELKKFDYGSEINL